MNSENITIDNTSDNTPDNTQDNRKEIDIKKRNKVLKTFIKTFQEFISDIKNSYPEYKDILENNYNLDVKDIDFNLVIIEHFMMGVNPYLIQISNKDELIFTEEDKKIVIFKDIEFSELWKKSNSTNKEIIWKYLHTLILLGNNYNATVRKEGIFEQFNEMLTHSELDNSSLNQISDQAKAMLSMVKSLSEENNDNGDNNDNEDNDGNLLGSGMFENTKIGEIAKELASELNFDEFSKNLGDLDGENAKDPTKLFDNLIGQDPMKLMGLIQNVGSKIQDKISSGQIDEKELVNEAQSMMKGLQDNPLFKGLNGEGVDTVLGNATGGLASSLFGGGGDDDEDLDDLDKDINKENSEGSSFNPDNIRKMGFNSLFSKLGGGNSNSANDNPMGNIGDIMSQMMNDPGMQQMISQMSQDPAMQQMAGQMHQNGNLGDMNSMMSQMMNNNNIQQMAQRMASNPNMQQMAQQMAGNPNMQQMAQQMAGDSNMQQMAQEMAGNGKSNVRIDKNKLRNMSARERLKKKLEERKKEQEQNLYTNNSDQSTSISTSEEKPKKSNKKKKKKN